MERKRKYNSLPDRWIEYSDVGKKIASIPIIPFKTPLREDICKLHFRTPEQWFTPAMLVEKIPNLKLIIDLTQTDRFYKREEFTKHGIRHIKINCPGGGHVIPYPDIVRRFINIIDGFMRNRDVNDKDAVIGVHCTHGLNRTGYLICKYMIQRCGFHPEKAIEEFENARGHKMERILYVDDIKNSNLFKEGGPLLPPSVALRHREDRTISNRSQHYAHPYQQRLPPNRRRFVHHESPCSSLYDEPIRPRYNSRRQHISDRMHDPGYPPPQTQPARPPRNDRKTGTQQNWRDRRNWTGGCFPSPPSNTSTVSIPPMATIELE